MEEAVKSPVRKKRVPKKVDAVYINTDKARRHTSRGAVPSGESVTLPTEEGDNTPGFKRS